MVNEGRKKETMARRATLKDAYRFLGDTLGRRGVDIDAVKEKLKRFRVEVPSWVFGPFGGGRFGAYTPPGAARTVIEKVDDAADDDHAVEPSLRMFEIFFELVKGDVVCRPEGEASWDYMIDRCSGLESRMHAVLHSVDSLQVSLVKALIVDRERLAAFQADHDVVRANRVLLDAFLTDVRPLVAAARVENGGEADPVEAYAASGYQEKIEKERE